MLYFLKKVLILFICATGVVSSNPKLPEHTSQSIILVTAPFRGDLLALNLGKTEKILLITKLPYERLSTAQKNKFDKVIILEKLDYPDIKTLVDKTLLNKASSKILVVNDEGLFLAAKLRTDLNIPGLKYQESLRFRDKKIAKEILENHGLRVPKYAAFDQQDYARNPAAYIEKIEKSFAYPIFIKPSNGCSSIGTCKVKARKGLEDWLKENQNQTSYDFEFNEFIKGTLYEADCIVQNGQIQLTRIMKNIVPFHKFLKGKAVGSITIPQQSSKFKRLEAYARKVINIMNPPDGVADIEFFENREGELVFGEINARRPGDLLNPTYLINTGIDFESESLNIQAGRKIKLPSLDQIDEVFAAWLEFPAKSGKVENYNALPNILSKVKLHWKVKPGDMLSDPVDTKNTVAEVLLWNTDYQQLKEDFYKLGREFNPIVLAKG